jgi:hypothetical protein
MALAASAWVTTEQESNLPVAAVAAVVAAALGAAVVAAALGALDVAAALDVVEADEPQEANRTDAHTATDIATG